MARPLRIEFAGALYHVTARGNARQDIFADDSDRRQFLGLLAQAVGRYDWYCHAYCLMGNHYHLLLETGSPSLSKGMKLLNGSYTQHYNQRHRRVGHLLQGRYKAILVQKESYLLEVARYIALNPVRAQMVRSAQEWPWSSYRATAGLAGIEPCLTVDWILAGFAPTRGEAQQRYAEFVQAGQGQPSPWQQLKNQVYLGDDAFVSEVQCKMDPQQPLADIPSRQKLAPVRPLADFHAQYASRDEAMVQAYRSGHYTLAQVGAHFGVSDATVSRAVKKAEGRGRE